MTTTKAVQHWTTYREQAEHRIAIGFTDVILDDYNNGNDRPYGYVTDVSINDSLSNDIAFTAEDQGLTYKWWVRAIEYENGAYTFHRTRTRVEWVARQMVGNLEALHKFMSCLRNMATQVERVNYTQHVVPSLLNQESVRAIRMTADSVRWAS
jgi:hypothetical protein